MKRISSVILFTLSLTAGCRTPDSSQYVFNPLRMMDRDRDSNISEEDVRENSAKFVENAKKEAARKDSLVQEHIQRGQQEIVAWYQDSDAAHIAAAKEAFQLALQLQPTQNTDAHHGLAVVADLEQNFAEAEQQYQRALAQSPGDSKLLGNLGYSYLLQNRLDESERYLVRATQIDPSNQDAVKHLGDVYLKQGRPGEAQAKYSQVMTAEQARQLVAASFESAEIPQGDSLVGTLLTEKEDQYTGHRTAGQHELQQLRNAQLQDRIPDHRASGGYVGQEQAARHGYAFPSTEQYPASEQRLQRSLAEIDRERHQAAGGHPIQINASTGETRYTHAARPVNYEMNATIDQHRASYPSDNTVQYSENVQGGNRPPYSQFVDAPTQISTQQPVGIDSRPSFQQQFASEPNIYGEMSPYQRQRFLASQQQSAGADVGDQLRTRPQTAFSHEPPPYQSAVNNQIAAAETMGRLRSPGPSADDPLQVPWYGGKPGAVEMVPDQSHYDRRLTAGPGQIGGDNVAGPQGSGLQTMSDESRQPQRFQNTPYNNQALQTAKDASTQSALPQPDAFEQASLQAARMGMGLGPGAMFSTMNQTAPQQQPGTNSHLNGNSFSQPERILPTDMRPLDLREAHLQQMHNGNAQQTQFGTASRYDLHLQQTGGTAPTFSSQVQAQHYEQQRQMEQQLQAQRAPVNQQLQQNMQDAWNQRPMNEHTASPSALPRMGSDGQAAFTSHQPDYGAIQSHQGMSPSDSQMGRNSIPPAYTEPGRRLDVVPPYEYQRNYQAIPPGEYRQGNRPQQGNAYGVPGQFDERYETTQRSNSVAPAHYQTTQPRSYEQSSSGPQFAPGNQFFADPSREQTYPTRQTGYEMRANGNMPLIVPGS